MFYLYIILCKDGSLYTGITKSLEERFNRHEHGFGSQHTKTYKPAHIVYTEKFSSRKEAATREKQIKGWRREKKINLIKFGKPILKT